MRRALAALLFLTLTAAAQAEVGLVPPPTIPELSPQPGNGWWQRTIDTRTTRNIVIAQAGQTATPQRTYTMADGYTEGRMAAEGRNTGGSFGGGLVCGLLTGLIGTGVLWGVTGGDEVPMSLASSYQDKGSDYTMGFANGYKERTQQKKRGARLGGGLLGTAAFVLILASGN